MRKKNFFSKAVAIEKSLICVAVTRRRHEAANGRTHADDARTPTHDASPTTDDDASQAGHDETRQIRQWILPFFVAMNRRGLVRTLGLTLGFISEKCPA